MSNPSREEPPKAAPAARSSKRFAALCCLVSLALALMLGLALGLGLSAAKSSGPSGVPVPGISLELGVPSLDGPTLLADAGGVATALVAAVSSLAAPGGNVSIVRVATRDQRDLWRLLRHHGGPPRGQRPPPPRHRYPM